MWNARLKEAQAGIKISRKKSIISDMQMTLPKSQKQRGTKEPLDEGEEKSKKAGLKLNIQKTKIMASSPITSWQISSFQFSCSVVSASLRPHELQHTRPPCLSPTPGVYPNPCPLSWWCHPTNSSSFVPFSSCLQSFPASGSSQMSQLFASGGQSIGVSASTTVLPMSIQDWFPLENHGK